MPPKFKAENFHLTAEDDVPEFIDETPTTADAKKFSIEKRHTVGVSGELLAADIDTFGVARALVKARARHLKFAGHDNEHTTLIYPQ